MESNLTLAVLLTPVAALAGAAIFKPRETYQWLDRKRYRYNVTLALYMLTPTERFIFNSILFLSLTLLTIAACLYLPEHIAIITRRVSWYCFGNDAVESASASGSMSSLAAAARATGESLLSEARRKTSGEAMMEMLRS